MGQPDADLMNKFRELCADLNMDKAAADEALTSYQRIGMNYTLEVSITHCPTHRLTDPCHRGRSCTGWPVRCMSRAAGERHRLSVAARLTGTACP